MLIYKQNGLMTTKEEELSLIQFSLSFLHFHIMFCFALCSNSCEFQIRNISIISIQANFSCTLVKIQVPTKKIMIPHPVCNYVTYTLLWCSYRYQITEGGKAWGNGKRWQTIHSQWLVERNKLENYPEMALVYKFQGRSPLFPIPITTAFPWTDKLRLKYEKG